MPAHKWLTQRYHTLYTSLENKEEEKKKKREIRKKDVIYKLAYLYEIQPNKHPADTV